MTIDRCGPDVLYPPRWTQLAQALPFPVSNNNVSSNVSMTDSAHQRRVVVPSHPTSSLGTLDISPPATLSGNSLTSSQATIQEPGAYSSRIPASRALGCGNPTDKTLQPLAGRPVGLAPGDTGRLNKLLRLSRCLHLGSAVVRRTLIRQGPRTLGVEIPLFHQRSHLSPS